MSFTIMKGQKQMTTQQMTWSNDNNWYYFEYEDGRTLFVKGDNFIEAVQDRKHAYLQERFPGKDVDFDLSDNDVEVVYNEAESELLDPEEWEMHALELESGQQLEETPNYWQYPAWIEVKNASPTR